jgi:hypothetical protein
MTARAFCHADDTVSQSLGDIWWGKITQHHGDVVGD